MTKFTIEELKQRELDHRNNVRSGIKVAHWNKSEEQKAAAENIYKTTQLKLANALRELIHYRLEDPNYREEE